jgi:hypothetical protein
LETGLCLYPHVKEPIQLNQTGPGDKGHVYQLGPTKYAFLPEDGDRVKPPKHYFNNNLGDG